MKTLFIAPALMALYMLLQTVGVVQAKTDTRTDSLRASGNKSASVAANFQHKLFHTSKRNSFRLAVASAEPATELEVLDLQGNAVQRFHMASDTVLCNLDVNMLQPGAYVLRIKAGQRMAEENFTVQ